MVQSLARDFEANKAHYLSPAYQESEVRKDYIDKFLIALGWDVNHDRQKNPFEQEVKVERGVNMQGSQRRADYAFYAAPNFRDVRFFAEAKKPFGDIASQQNYFQTIRYGWNAKTPIAILTDFEQFQILDCRYKPNIDSALTHCIRKFHFSEYADKDTFSFIYFLFSREAVANGSLDKFAETLSKKRGKAVQRGLFKGVYQSIDDSFLEELDTYRDSLARGFKNNNPNLDGDMLTEMTQRTIDRLVFMRFIEDKLIYPDNLVGNFGDKGTAWQDFVAASRHLDGIYNGIVFKRHAIMDAPSFKVDEDAFADICGKLSHDNSPYDFNSIPIHILGSIYERFLGKVIVTTDKRARLEEKPEVRKAGGVYYTPEYIVRYIVENTVGKVIADKTPAQIEDMRFADIACGSGSFLLGVFDLLLRYHVKWFNENPEKAKRAGCVPNDDGGWSLSLHQRRHILVNNIYGVDIDHQAVEVAQLSLYLKLLQDETTASARHHQLEFQETILPSLNKNIVCGNSLIGMDILTGQLLARDDLASDEERKLNPMDYEQRFPEVMKNGGFDAIVGNPPYVRPHNLSRLTKQYYWEHFRSFTHKADLYCCFIENAIRLLKPEGLFSYIVSHGWLRLNSFQALRRLILEKCRILKLVELPYNVFDEAQVATGIFVFEKDIAGEEHKLSVIRATPALNNASFCLIREIPQLSFKETFQNVFDISITPETEAIKDKMRKGPLIGDYFQICFGLKTGDDKKFLHHTRGLHAEDKPLLRGDDVKKYETNYNGEFVWYVPNQMRKHRPTARPGDPVRFEQPKVLVKDTSSDFACTYEGGEYYVKDVLIVIPKPEANPDYSLQFVAGVVNSKALHFYYKTTFQTIHVQNEEFASLPLPKIKHSNAADKTRHNKIVALVEQMIAAKKQLAGAQSDKDKDFFGNKCAAIDRQIDALVYELYELTPEEIKIVENATESKSAEPAS